MDNLIGRRFLIDQTEYAVVDVRNMSGETLVYAEPSQPQANTSQQSAEAARVAIRSVDFEPLLAEAEETINRVA